MATIKIVEKYIFDGIEFNSLKDLKSYVITKLGTEVIDKIIKVCPPAQMRGVLKILEVLSQKEVRESLTKYLNVTYEFEGQNHNFEYINILDTPILK
jgi:hypothetical protein